MKKIDIILCGVGGQGILSIATVIGAAATKAGLNLKQAEVHGMSQRGGDVQSNLRLSDSPIWSDLIALGQADLIISMEPMEALRYLPYLSKDGVVVTASKPFVNIPDYPSEEALEAALDSVPKLIRLDIDEAAREAGNPRGANMALLGAASPYIGVFGPDDLQNAIVEIFAPKGDAVVESNIKAFKAGLSI